MRAIVFGSPAARAIAEQMRAVETQERTQRPARPLGLTFKRWGERIREREREEQRLAAWNAWAQGKKQED